MFRESQHQRAHWQHPSRQAGFASGWRPQRVRQRIISALAVEASAPAADEFLVLLLTLIVRRTKMLMRQSVPVEDTGRPAWPSRMPTARCRERCGRSSHFPHRLRPARRAEGADGAKRYAAGGAGPPAALRRHRRAQPACRRTGGSTRSQAAVTVVPLHHPSCAVGPTGAAQRGRQVELKLKAPGREG